MGPQVLDAGLGQALAHDLIDRVAGQALAGDVAALGETHEQRAGRRAPDGEPVVRARASKGDGSRCR